MQSAANHRNEAALYWTAVSLIVCEGLSIDKAAERLGVEPEWLREILQRRQTLRLYQTPSAPEAEPSPVRPTSH
jgi:predicted HTH domain antitoxin